jgi:hypothetical protein
MYSDTIVLSGPEVMLAAPVGDVARPQSVKRDYARLIGHFRHVSKPPFATFGEGDATSSCTPYPGFGV